MNMLNISFNICGVVFITFLMTFYFMKKSLPNIENKIYRFILIFSLLIPTVDLIYWISCFYLKDYQFIIEIEARIFLTCLLGWLVFLSYYIIILTNRDKKFVKDFLIKDEKITIWPFLLIIIIALFELLLSFGCVTDKDGIVLYTVGNVYFFNVLLVVFFLMTCLLSTLLGRKKINLKKASPMFVFVFYELVIFAVYWMDRTICIFTLSSTLTSYLMFFTIENPDLKLIKELTLAKIQAEKSNKAKSDFLASMSHEIRTPLNAIVGLTQMIKVNDDLNQIREDSDDILKASSNLLEIVDGILDINILETNNIEVNEVNYNIYDLFNELENLSKVKIDEKKLSFKLEYLNYIPNNLYGDKEKIKRIIINLLTNAIKYTDYGSITLRVSSIGDNDINLKVDVIDTGKGIKKEQLDLIFNKFYRSEDFKDSDIEGTGLGLSITKALVELLNGKISVESEFGKGSIFTIIIPQKVITDNCEIL